MASDDLLVVTTPHVSTQCYLEMSLSVMMCAAQFWQIIARDLGCPSVHPQNLFHFCLDLIPLRGSLGTHTHWNTFGIVLVQDGNI